MIPDLIEAIQQDVEWLSTTDGDEIECISIENLEGILSKLFNQKINIKQNGEENL